MLSAMSYNKGYRCVYSLNIQKRASDKVPKKGHLPRNSFIAIVRTVFSSPSETLDFPLVANLHWSLETLILR